MLVIIIIITIICVLFQSGSLVVGSSNWLRAFETERNLPEGDRELTDSLRVSENQAPRSPIRNHCQNRFCKTGAETPLLLPGTSLVSSA